MALVAVGLLIAVPCALAATKVSMRDQAFIRAAEQNGLTVVKLGEMASHKGLRDGVKEFGRLMARDQRAINSQLKALAAKKGVSLAGSLDERHQVLVEETAGFADSDFDNAYTTGMSKLLKAENRRFKDEAAATSDADIRAFVNNASSVLIEYYLRIDVMHR